MTRPFSENGGKGGGKIRKPGATALAALGWLSAFAVLWLWVLDLVARDNLSIGLLVFSLAVGFLASAVVSVK